MVSYVIVLSYLALKRRRRRRKRSLLPLKKPVSFVDSDSETAQPLGV
jgi:hypothetical protein